MKRHLIFLQSMVHIFMAKGTNRISELLQNLAQLGNTELSIITDFPISQQFHALRELNSLDTPHYSYSVKELRRKQLDLPVEPCPIFGEGHGIAKNITHHDEEQSEEISHSLFNSSIKWGDEDKPKIDHSSLQGKDDEVGTVRYTRDMHYKRRPFFPWNKFHRSIFVWVTKPDSLREVLKMFDATIMHCKQKIEPGIFNTQTRFYFYLESYDLVQDLFSHDKLRRLPRVAAILDTEGFKGEKFTFHNYDFFHDGRGTTNITMSYVWSPQRRIDQVADVFTNLSDFHEHHFTIATNPWSHHVLADEIPEDEGGTPTNKYRNYWGYEIDLLEFTARVLNFQYTLVNPADGNWGHIEMDGTWSGLVAEAAMGSVDFVICDMFIVYGRVQVFDATIPFDLDFMAFVTPNPHPVPKWLSLLRPFQPLVWTLFGLSVLVIGLIFWGTAIIEGYHVGDHFQEWAILKDSFWYAYGTLVGESITRDTRSQNAPALRFLIGTWVIFCMIATYSYGGSVKSFMTNPLFTQPIRTLEELIDSGLPWGMVLYGEEEEEMMAESTDPVIQVIWRDKIVTEYSQVPQIEGVYLGKKAFIDWKSGLEPAIFVRYSNPDGTPLIYKSPNPVFMPNLPGWAFYTFNPVRPRFDETIQRAIEAGLIDFWKFRTWYRMKEKSRLDGVEPIRIEKRANIRSLSLDDLQGVFYLVLLALLGSVLTLMLELLKKYCGQSQRSFVAGPPNWLHKATNEKIEHEPVFKYMYY
ncbi:glutamate receptor ionotropic, NMDA 2D-like isoform X1 [Tigriopus californicus]|uniref:glutamate receptor ionotropic, NMDA 2D-like isoform X1 n=1 Tax=Tigriopus californicus TaxID=6832 RepID=UPI0027DA8EAD|nr:glutamate receptor ionotropic, NMDA 2D-like isoform X1 [Tigriopus californicus]